MWQSDGKDTGLGAAGLRMPSVQAAPQEALEKKPFTVRGLREWLAGRQGLEPRYADPESAVLPLDDLPTGTEAV
jgi:hypothetical protein